MDPELRIRITGPDYVSGLRVRIKDPDYGSGLKITKYGSKQFWS